MRLDELAGVKQFRNMTATQVKNFYKKYLSDGPLKVLSNGHHAVAIMIGDVVYKMWLKDSAYVDFANYALANQGNPFLPKFYSQIKTMPAFFLRHIEAPDYVNYIKMEKLTPVPESLKVEFNLPNDPKANKYRQMYFVDYLDSFGYMDSKEPNVAIRIANGLTNCVGYDLKPEHIPESLILFTKTMYDIIALVRKNTGHFMDLREDNFMMRGNQIVIVDPLANEGDAHLNTEFKIFDSDVHHRDMEVKQGKMSGYAHRREMGLTDKTHEVYRSK